MNPNLRLDEIKEYLNKGLGETLPKISQYKRRNNNKLNGGGVGLSLNDSVERILTTNSPSPKKTRVGTTHKSNTVRKSREQLIQKSYGKAVIAPQIAQDQIKIGQMSEQKLIEASKLTHERAIQAWKNAEKQRFFNTKMNSSIERQMQQKRKVEFQSENRKRYKDLQDSDQEDEWLHITK